MAVRTSMASGGDTAASSRPAPSGAAEPPIVQEYAFGPFRIDVPYCQLWRGEELIPLTPKAFDMLLFLVRHRDHIVSKEELLGGVWPDSFVSADTLTQNIWAIRRGLGDDSDKQEFIVTVPRRGYRFTASVTEKRREPAAEHRTEFGSPSSAASALDGGDTPSEIVATAFAETRRLSAPDVAVATDVPATGAVLPRFASSWTRRLLYGGLAIALGVTWWAFRAGDPAGALPTGVVRFTEGSPPGATLASGGVLSPDGRQLVFVAQDEASGNTQLWLRSLDAAQPRPLPGTAAASRPFWSPDGRYVGFFSDGNIKRVGLAADPPRTLAPVVGIRIPGASWGSDDLILFASSTRSGLSSIPGAGGDPRPVTVLDAAAGDISHRWPYFLPDGQHFLYSVLSTDEKRSGVYVGGLDSREAHVRLLDGSVASVIYAPPGYLLYVRNGLLMVRPFDASSRQVTGEAVSLAGNVSPPGLVSDSLLSASNDGSLTFGGGNTPERLVWMDRTGRQLDGFDVPLHNLSISPDGRQVLGTGVSSDPGGGVWLLDLERGVPTKIIPNGFGAVWSPDGRQIAYVTELEVGRRGLVVRPADGSSAEKVLWQTTGALVINEWSADQRYLVNIADEGKQNIGLIPASGERRPILYAPSTASQIQAQVSPNGRLIAYTSDESGVWEVYLDSFPTPGQKRRISLAGGAQPQWSRSGRELFYLALDKNLMVAEIGNGPVGRPQVLFRVPILGDLTSYRSHYAVAPDGGRFLFETSNHQPITVLLNWASALR